MNILNKEISYYTKCNHPEETTNINFKEFIDMVKSNKFKVECDYLRSETDKEKRRIYKFNKLPAVTIAGTFSYRNMDKLISASGFAAMDIDIYNEDLTELKENLKKDKYVFSIITSPSGGLKVIIKIPFCETAKEYDNVYSQLLDYYNKFSPNQDKSTRDISRLFFLTYDKDLFLNETANIFPAKKEILLPSKIEIEKIEKEIPRDTSRSAKEYWEVVKLIKKGKNKGQIFADMVSYSKWEKSPAAYKEMTYKKALDYVTEKQIDNAKKKDEEAEIQTSLIINENIIAEQINQEGISKFCIYNKDSEEIEIKNKLENKGVVYIPIAGEEVRKNVVKLPSNVEEYGTDEELDNEIKSFIIKWLDIPEDVLQFAVWNIKRSWVYDRFHTLNYLRALGDTGQGKSRFLDTLGSIHYKPIATSGATTAAPVFRIIEKWHGTLIMDEADFQKSDESQDMIKIINQGYEKDKWIMRCDQNDANKIAFFDPFCPKIIATRKAFEDKAVESRCITQVMKGTSRQDIPYNINDSFYKDSEKIRNMLLLWRFRNYFIIDPDIMPEGFDYRNLEPRVKQIISSFVSLFANDLQQLSAFKEYITDYQETLIEERKNSFDGAIVDTLGLIIAESGKEIEDININAQDIIERGQITGFKGNLIKPRSLSNHLKALGFKNVVIKKVEKKTKRCIPLEKNMLKHLFKRYGVTMVTPLEVSPLASENAKKDEDKKNGGLPIQRNNRNYVTDENIEKEQKNLVEEINDENENIKNIKKFDKKQFTYHKCSISDCNETKCNFDTTGQPYCEKHWERCAER